MRAQARAVQVLGWLVGAAALAALTVASTRLAYPEPSPWDPGIGVAAALVWLGGAGFVLPVILGQLAAAWWCGWEMPVGVGVAPALVSAALSVMLGLVLRRFLARDPRAWSVRQVLWFATTALAAGVGMVLLLIAVEVPGMLSAPAAFRVAVATAAGMVTGLPAIAVLRVASRWPRWRLGERALDARTGEFLGHMAFTLVVGAAAYVLHGPTGERFWSLYFIPLVWTAFRFEMAGVLASLLLIWLEGILLAVLLHTPLTTLTNYHFFFFNFAVTAFLLGAALRARREAEREKAEGDRRLREEITFRASLLENVGEAVVGTEETGKIVFWNAAAERLFAVPREEALGHDVRVVVPHDPASLPEMQRAHLARERWSGEVFVRRRDGATLHALATSVPLDGPDGRGGYVGVWRDITAMRELEAQLAQAQKMDAIGRLAGGVAHDFNNLLTVVEFNAMEAGALAAEDPELAPLIDGIKEAADRASGMTRQLLSFTRAKQYLPKVFAVAGVVAGLEEMLQRLLGERVDIVVNSACDGLVRGDVGQLEQVLVNLAVNGRDAMPCGGTLRIDTDELPLNDEAARMRDLRPGDYVRIRVTDNGLGMDQATLSMAFEPFFTTKAVGEGTGLGLSTAYAMVRQAGGQIWAESAPGDGTTVSILLPRAASVDDAEEEVQSEQPVTAGRTGTVLVAEDDERVAAVAERALARAGYTVVLAADGAAALAELRTRRKQIDLLLTDVVMPRMTGPELVRHARALCPDLPIVLMSGYTDDMLEPLPQPFTFIAKPFGPRDLLGAVQTSLGRG